ncbi:MAG: response regulator [Gammaproteobacteria bacterium]|nr:response regulator [Gammaproteobacteria bacterium]
MDRSKTKWSLGKKIVALFLVLGLSFAVGSYFALQVSVLPVFAEFERESSETTLARVDQALKAAFRELAVVNREYTLWDETYSYAQGRNPDFRPENLDTEYWRTLDIDLVLVFDVHGNQLYSSLTDPSDGSHLSLENELLQPLTASDRIASHASSEHSYSGILQTRSTPLLVVSYPILKSDETGPPAGSFVLGRFLGSDSAIEFGKRATADVAIHPVTPESAPFGTATTMQRLVDSDEGLIQQITDTSIIQYRLLRDIRDTPAVVLEVRTPRRITQIGSAAVQTFMTFLIAVSMVFLLSAWLFTRRIIISPIRALKDQMFGIRQTGNLSTRADSRRSDEVGLLAAEFNELTSRLSHAQEESEKARQESEIARDEAVAMSKTKSEFLARMSHEIRTPMNGVLGMTELLKDTQLDNKQQRFTQTIYESAESLLNIINDILDFSKIEAGRLELDLLETDLNNLLEETVEGLAGVAHKKGLELISMAPADLDSTVYADPGRLRQVLTNLVGNAIKFTDSGEVIVTVTATEVDAANIEVLFEIKDTGVGIHPDKQEDIFESFAQEDGSTTRVYGGTGLGLAISKQLVELMGGDLTLLSAPGKGSTFSFSLLMRKGSGSDCRRSTYPQFVAGAKVLIVDDNAANREILEHQLRSWRAYTDSAASAADALRILESAVASGDVHDMAILDMHMPHKDGIDLARAIRANPDLVDLKLMILSSVANSVADDTMADLNIAGQLTKPIRQSRLYDALVVMLGGEEVARSHSRLKMTSTKALSGSVLLAEDNPVNQAVAIGMLEAMGLSVVIAGDGHEAIEKASSGPFDVILMDCQMPGVDGFQATEAIRRLQSESGRVPTPIVAITANALKGDRERCLAAGMDEYLTKPYTSEQLHAVLSLFLQPGAVLSADPITRTEDQDSVDALPEFKAPLDREVLDGLSRLQQPGAPSILRRIVDLYLESSRELKNRLRDAVESANAASLREVAHTLKSSSANVGALGLADLCRRLEVMGREADLSDVSTVHARFEAEYERVVTALELEVQSSAA